MKAIPSCSDKSTAVQSLTEATKKVTMAPKDKSDSRGAPRKSILYRVFTGALGMLRSDVSPVEDEILQFELEEENLQSLDDAATFQLKTNKQQHKCTRCITDISLTMTDSLQKKRRATGGTSVPGESIESRESRHDRSIEAAIYFDNPSSSPKIFSPASKEYAYVQSMHPSISNATVTNEERKQQPILGFSEQDRVNIKSQTPMVRSATHFPNIFLPQQTYYYGNDKDQQNVSIYESSPDQTIQITKNSSVISNNMLTISPVNSAVSHRLKVERTNSNPCGYRYKETIPTASVLGLYPQLDYSLNIPYLKPDEDGRSKTGSPDSVISNDASASSGNQHTTSGKVRRSTVVTKTSKQSTSSEWMRKTKVKKEKILPSSSHHHKKLSSKRTPPSQSQSGRKGVAPSRAILMPTNIRFIRGTKVTMLDEEKKIFIIDLLSPGVCNKIRRMAHNYVTQIHSSGSTKPTWRTLYTYTKMDLPCNEVPNLSNEITDLITEDVKTKVPNLPDHTGVEMHYDGSDFTWQLMLMDVKEYEGGGTYMRCMRETIKLHQGQVLVHPGELYHKGVDITSGVRSLIVGFMDGFDPKIPDDSENSDNEEEYEKNVRTY
eukprot:scaffold119690_cov56-Attheya_sp.AAC.3